ncbi:MAK10-like protein [Tanacetum coccineum]
MCLPELQQQTLKPSFEARVQSYMAAPIERMQRFKEAIYKQREETNERMFEMFIILKEYTKGKALEKVLVREEVSKFVTKYANAISLIRIEDDADKECGNFIDKEAVEQIKVAEKEKVVEDVEDNESDRSMNEDSTIWDNIGKLKFMNALANQVSDVNTMPLTIYNKITSEKPIRINIRLSLANHSYVYLEGIAEDVLIDVANFVYPVDFVILDIKKDDYMPLILETMVLTMARAEIKCWKGLITLRAGKVKVRFLRTLRFPSKVKEKKKET